MAARITRIINEKSSLRRRIERSPEAITLLSKFLW